MANEPVSNTGTPNPIQLFKQQYPGYANTPDVHVYNFLANPANFKKAFPGYANAPDSQIQGFMEKFVPGDYSHVSPQFVGPLPGGMPKPEAVPKLQSSIMQRAEAEAGKFLKPLQTPVPSAAKIAMPGVYGIAADLAKTGEQIPKTAPAWEQGLAGVAQTPKAMIDALTSPENAITLGGFMALPEGAVSKVLGGLFTAQQASQTYSEFKQGMQAWKNKDYRKAGMLLSSAPMNALFTVLGADKLAGDLAGAVKEAKGVTSTEKPVQGEVISKEPLKPPAALPGKVEESKAAEVVAQTKINQEPKPFIEKAKLEPPKPQTTEQKIDAIRAQVQTGSTYATQPAGPRTEEIQKYAKKAQGEINSLKKQLPKLKEHEKITAQTRIDQLQVFIDKVPAEVKVPIATPEPTRLPQIKSPVREAQFYPDAQTAQALQKFEGPQPEIIRNAKIQAAQNQLAKIDHTLYGIGSGRVSNIQDNQRRFLERERTKAQRELKFQVFEHVKTLTPHEQAQKLVEYGNRADSNGKIGSALLAASKMQENPPEWLMEYAKELRSNNPSLRKATLDKAMQKMRPGAITEEDHKALDLVDNYLHTLFEAERARGISIPLTTTAAHLRKLGQKFTRQEKSDRQIYNAIKNRIGVKREKAAVASIPQEQAPKAEVTPTPILLAPEPKPSEPLKTVPVKAPKESQVPLEAVEPEKLSVKKLPENKYEVRSGNKRIVIYRDPETRSWYETPEATGRHHSELYLGETKADVLKRLQERWHKTEVPTGTVQPEVSEHAPVHMEGGALSLEQLEEKGFAPVAETLNPEEEALKSEQESENARKYASLAKNLEHSSLRDAFKRDMLKAVKDDGGDVEKADQAIDSMPLDKMLAAPWKKHTRGVIEYYAQKAQPTTVKRTVEITSTEGLSDTAKQLLATVDFLEDSFPNAGEYDRIRKAIPARFSPEQKLARYAEVLQNYLGWSEDGDTNALKKAVRDAGKDSEKGAITITHEKLDSLVLYKKAQKLGLNASFTHSSPLYPASWIIGHGPNQIQIEVSMWDSHVKVANRLEGVEAPKDFDKLSGAARTAAMKRWNQAGYDWLDKGAIRKASENAYQIGRYTPENLQAVWDLFKRNVYKLKQTQEDPALFIESARNLKGELSDDMEVPLTHDQVQDKFGGDIVKAVTNQLGQYSRANMPSLYSGIPIPEIIHGLKDVGHGFTQLAKDWSMSDLDGEHISNGFLRRSYYSELAQATVNAVQGEVNHDTAVLHNQLTDDRKRWDSIPKDQLEDRVREFYKAHSNNGAFSDPKDQELSNLLKALTDVKYNQLIASGQKVNYFQNYFPGIWENTDLAKKVARAFVGGKGLFDVRGKRHFQAKKHLSFEDALNAGLKPRNWNPVHQWLTYLESMDRFLVNLKTQNYLKGLGLMKFARGDSMKKLPPMPEGMEWKEIKHPALTVTYRNEAGERVMAGKWYAVRPFADAINRLMEPTWNKNMLYHGVLMYSNYFNLFKLGLSGMHGLMTVMNNAIWSMHHGFVGLTDTYRMGQLNPMAAVKGITRGLNALTFVGPSILNYMKGLKLRQEYVKPGTHLEYTDIVNRMIDQNLAVKWPSYYAQPDIQKFWTNFEKLSMSHPISWEGLKYGSQAALHFLPMIFRYMASPLMDHFVPLSKMASDAMAIERELWLESIKHPRTFTPEQRAIRAMQIAHAHDESFGEMQLDNRNWPKWVKEMLKVVFVSGTWNSGTALLHAKGVLDFAKEPFKAAQGKGFELPPRTGYLVAMAVMTAWLGFLIQRLEIGKYPQSTKDLFAPQIPGKDSEGNQNRIWLKSYVNDDVNFVYDPKRTITNKFSGPISEFDQLMNNRDWEGYQIYNPQQAPWSVKNLGNIFYWGLLNKTPISVSNLERERGLGAGLPAQVGAFFGIQPAPLHVRNDAFENRIYSILQTQFSLGPRTFEQKTEATKMRPLQIARESGQLSDSELTRLVQNGTLSPSQGKKLWARNKTNFMEQNFNKLTLPQMLWAWEVANKAEKSSLAGVLAKKASNLSDWSLKDSVNSQQAEVQASTLQHQLLHALNEYPMERIASQLYMEAGKDRLQLATAHFMEQKPPHLRGIPTIRELAGMPAPKAATMNIGMENALNGIDKRIKAALQRGDNETIQQSQIDRRELLLSWWSQYQKEHPRINSRPLLHPREF